MKLGLLEAGLPNAEHDAGSTATIELCALIAAMGHTLEYVYTGENPWGRGSDLTQYSIPYRKAAVSADALRGMDAAVISRPGPASQWLHACHRAGTPIIYFGHDIHYLRFERGNAVGAKPVGATEIKLMQALEQRTWKQSAAVIYPSPIESAIVNHFCGRSHAFDMPIYDMEALHAYAAPAAPSHAIRQLLFVGGAEHQPNADAIRWFTTDVLPHLHMPFHLRVIGDWPETLRTNILARWGRQGQTLEFCGRVDKAALLAAYPAADIVIAPLRFGAGIKRKIVEGLVLGRPVLSTPVGYDGITIPDALKQHLIAEADGSAYAAKLEALTRAGLQPELTRCSAALASYYSPSQRKQVLENVFSLL